MYWSIPIVLLILLSVLLLRGQIRRQYWLRKKDYWVKTAFRGGGPVLLETAVIYEEKILVKLNNR